jgi:hypothetical protein
MKKILLLTVLVLAFAVPAFSQEVKLDFRASGYIDMKTENYRFNWTTQGAFGWGGNNGSGAIFNTTAEALRPYDPHALVYKNQATYGTEWNRTVAYVESRGRLKFDAIMGKELSGTIFLEMDSVTWGDYRNGAQTGTNAAYPFYAGGKNAVGWWGTDQVGLELKNMYFDVAVPYIPLPITMRFGTQPFGLRSNMFMYVDGAGITSGIKVDPATIVLYWAKMLNGRYGVSDGDDLYGLQVSAKVSTITLGGYGFYFNMKTYPLNATSLGTPIGANMATSDSNKSQMWWLGAYADGKMGPVNINFDFVYDTGNVKNRISAEKVNYEGFATRLKIDFPWEAFNFGVVGAYGSGGDTRKSDSNGKPGQLVTDPAFAAAGYTSTKVSSYVVPPASETGSFNEGETITASYINGGFTGPNYNLNGNALHRGSMGGIWLAKIYAGYKVAPDYKVTLQGLYYGDTTKHGDTFGYALNWGGTLATSSLQNGSTIGYELSLVNEWQVYKNLMFRFGGGYLWPGNALKFFNPITLTNDKPKGPYIITSALTYTF